MIFPAGIRQSGKRNRSRPEAVPWSGGTPRGSVKALERLGDGDRLRRGLFSTMTRTKAKRGSGHRGPRGHREMRTSGVCPSITLYRLDL
jgi:hypothetical protein